MGSPIESAGEVADTMLPRKTIKGVLWSLVPESNTGRLKVLR